jgi:hypothetical protein
MPRVSPTLEGFRAALRRPVLTLAEVTWRWTVGATACALFIFSFIEYLDSLSVTDGERLLLRSRQPLLVGRAISHIIQGSFNRAAIAVVLGVLGLSAFWVIAASLGRNVTVRALLDYFVSRRGPDGDGPAPEGIAQRENDAMRPPVFRSLLGLNFLRAALAVAAILSFAAAAIFASFVSPATSPHPGIAFLVFVPLAGAICILWWSLNWLLSLAGIFSVRDGEGTVGAISSAATFCGEHLGPVLAVSTWYELAHIVAFAAANTIVTVPLIFIRIVPSRVVIAGMFLIGMVYFAVVDWLYTARLAGYVCILEMPETSLGAMPTADAPTQPGIDRDEPILSDVPGLIAET